MNPAAQSARPGSEAGGFLTHQGAKHRVREANGHFAVLPHAVHTGSPIRRYAATGCTITENFYPAGKRSRSHAHESAFVHATLAGQSLDQVMGTRERESRGAGDVGFIPADWHHSHSIQNPGLRGLTIDIQPAYAADLIASGADFSRPFVVSNPDIFGRVLRLREEIEGADSLSRLQIDAIVVDIFVGLLRLKHERESNAPRWLKRIVATIEDRYREEFSLDELAADAHVHRVHVSRSFRRHYGETLGDYIRRRRMKEARRLLEYGSGSIAEIAVDVGYHDESHFSKAFKKVVGTTPGRYRQVVRAAPGIPRCGTSR